MTRCVAVCSHASALALQLAKLSALSAAETTREQRKTAMFDFFGICFSIAQV
jgi:hypothetical protein